MGRIGNYESRVKPYLEQIKMWLHGGATEQDCYNSPHVINSLPFFGKAIIFFATLTRIA